MKKNIKLKPYNSFGKEEEKAVIKLLDQESYLIF